MLGKGWARVSSKAPQCPLVVRTTLVFLEFSDCRQPERNARMLVLFVAVVLYLAAVIGVGSYIYVNPGEGIPGLFGYSVGQMLVVGLIAVFLTRKSTTWTASRTFSAVLLITTGLTVAGHSSQIIDIRRLSSLQAEIAPAKNPEEALSILRASENPIAPLFARLIETVQTGQIRLAAIFTETEDDTQIMNSLLPATLADPAAFENAHKAVVEWLSTKEVWQSRVEATFAELVASLKQEVESGRDWSSETRHSFLRGLDEGISDTRPLIIRRVELDMRLLTAIEQTLSFLKSRQGRYQVSNQTVLFTSTDDVDQYNHLVADVHAISSELIELGTEFDRRNEQWTSLQWLKPE